MIPTQIAKQPIVTIFNALEDLQELAKSVGNEYTEVQLVKLGIEIIKLHATLRQDSQNG